MFYLLPIFTCCNFILENDTLKVFNVSTITRDDIETIGHFSKLQIGSNVFVIDSHAFYNQSKLTNVVIGESVTTIKDYAFYGCSMDQLIIPISISLINESAFDACTKLKAIKISENNEIYSNYNNDGIVYDKNISKVILCPSAVEGIVNIPSSVQLIEDYAFEDCFLITNINIPNSVKSIGYSSFSDCRQITNVIIPDSVEKIQEFAFYRCLNLEQIEISSSVSLINESAFDACTKLKAIKISENNEIYSNYNNDGIVYDKNISKVILCPSAVEGIVNIPSSVQLIEDYAFEDCFLITNINIPNSVKSIGVFSFINCSLLTNLSIPNSITVLQDFQFYGCLFHNVNIPDSVVSIGLFAFQNCPNLVSVTISLNNVYYSNYNNDGIVYNKNITKLIFCPSGKSGDVVIPKTILAIQEYAFEGCSLISSIDIPSSVRTIGLGAFINCNSIKKVIIPENINVIDNYAFSSCMSLEIVCFYGKNEPSCYNTTFDSPTIYVTNEYSKSTFAEINVTKGNKISDVCPLSHSNGTKLHPSAITGIVIAIVSLFLELL